MEEEKKTPVTDETSEAPHQTPAEEEAAAPEEGTEAPAGSDGEEPKGRRGEIKKLRRELEETKKALEASEARAAELDDRVLRLAAEYDNFRKRTQTERSNVYANAVSDTLAGLLPVIDNLRYAAKYAGGDADKLAEGLEMILSKLPETFEKLGITPFGEVGETFDPALHNAVMHVEDESLGEGVIVEVLQQGYKYGDKVLRYAMVKTAN
ncbi:MAG: nucleotide exchange factor GrpE [Clostridia bacterium]|nr:nucleotide exchange factor GrpE [Clostridia bacterium]MBR4186790.1 nucleotide exchange factor GrpE [Clostridia bacterium]